ncbi:Branched-chain amino acid transport protein [Desulfatibacillum alkenivorans DSM 16219]|jgi:branched-subunit amino acid transport protein|uniref:Branched-chain amino acid transport protein n=1 Tax=Desulfatibacillum alkenivorans DSM 16219 TaxID=1121393 RepID=A0A1M6Y267_9BACT|nr:AzlD domain-containing protein [Desulfatibacillum alkenivorans]SHL12286.1 Branched-chain amino acid transport protein [Desulfatibacillum alkenivorans DSM 16219]
MTTFQLFLIFIGMGLVTYLPRFIPLALFAKREVPAWFSEWLSFIPPALLAALLAPDLIVSKTAQGARFDFLNPKLFVAIPVFFIAAKTKSLGGTVISGMALYWLAQKLIESGFLG